MSSITALSLATQIDSTETNVPTNKQPNHIQMFPNLFKGLGNVGESYEICLKLGSFPLCFFT